MKLIKIAGILLLVVLLTILSQVGGIIFLLTRLAYPFINSKIRFVWWRFVSKSVTFFGIYFLLIATLVPMLAGLFGRVPLPISGYNQLYPANKLTYLLNRHYVKPELKELVIKISQQMSRSFPGTKTRYLDAGFPFFDGFPLLPHLSHNDGQKIDFAFYYLDKNTNQPSDRVPSPIGYGISENPRPGEINTTAYCLNKGYWQYGFLEKLISQKSKERYIFDSVRTRELISMFDAQYAVKKIFLEPHLKQRLQLLSNKIRFHGCGSVKHDDHFHIQLGE